MPLLPHPTSVPFALLLLMGLLSASFPVFADDLAVLKANASKGDAPAQTILGSIYSSGRDDVDRDEKEGLKWARLAADQGYAPAQWLLGDIYAEGIGVEKDEKEAVKWYRKAADQGLAVTQCNLGVRYLAGQDVGKDEAEAVRWFRKAAGQEHAAAQSNLGVCFLNGLGVGKDEVEAVKWFRRAAKNGSEQAQLNLAVCYFNGRGVGKDLAAAHEWAAMAEVGEERVADQARELRSQIEAAMSAAQIQELADQARELGSQMVALLSRGATMTNKIVKDVQIILKGRGKLDENRVRSQLSARVGQPYTEEDVDRDTRALYRTGAVEYVDIRGEDVAGGVKIIVEITRYPDIFSDVAFAGNNVFDNKDLIKIDDGTRDSIHHIRFEGNTVISTNTLLGLIKSKEQGGYSNDDVQIDIMLIEQALQDDGYVYAKVTEVRCEPVSGMKMDIIYVIHEGAKHDMTKVSVSGNTRFTQDELMKDIRQKAGSSYKVSFVKADEKMIQDYYGSRGYADARVETSVEDDGKNSVKIDYHIEEGEKSVVSQINITGNVYITKDIILRELKLAPGDVFNTVLIDKARETLKDKGYFRELDFRGTPTVESGRKELDIHILER